MGLTSTRKTVFVILSIVTVFVFLVSRQHTTVPQMAQSISSSTNASYFNNINITVTAPPFLNGSRKSSTTQRDTSKSNRTGQRTTAVSIASTIGLEKTKGISTTQLPVKISTGWKNEYTEMDALVEQYQKKIEVVRKIMLQDEIVWTKFSKHSTVLDGYDPKLFEKAGKDRDITPVYLTNSMVATRRMLPAKKYYNYIASKSTCHKMDLNSYHGPTLLNKTCVHSVQKVHKPVLLDKIQLSVGIPFKMTDKKDLPVGPDKKKVLLHFGFVVKNAVILNHGVVFSHGSALQPQRCKPDARTKLPPSNHSLPEYSEVFSLTEQLGTMFYHLVSEDLPRIAPYLNFLLKNKKIKIHCKQKGFLTNMLRYLGISKDRLVSGNIRAKIVYMPAGTACGRPGVFTTQYLSTLFLRKLPETLLNAKKDTIILIKRSSKSRQFLFHDDILKMLQFVAEERGLRAVEYRDDPVPPLGTTMELFYRAVMVIAPHGAGLSNLLFSRPGVVVLESYCMTNLCFRNLMANTGHIHHGYMNDDFKCLEAKPDNFRKDVEQHLDLLGHQKIKQ